MRKRKNNAEAISLFSFQDIMASVIGMLFFIVILMSLSIVTQTSPAADAADDKPPADVALLGTKARQLREEIAALEAAVTKTSKKMIHATALDPQAALADLKQMQANLEALYKTIGEEEAALQDMAARAEPKRRDVQDKEKRLRDLQKEIADSKTRLDHLQAAPRLAFIIDAHPDRLAPWLIEASKDHIRVGAKDGGSSFVEFRAATERKRLDLLFAWAKNQDPKTHYFVILLKPSAVRLIEGLEHGLKKMGFDIGLDLLPENWAPFQ